MRLAGVLGVLAAWAAGCGTAEPTRATGSSSDSGAGGLSLDAALATEGSVTGDAGVGSNDASDVEGGVPSPLSPQVIYSRGCIDGNDGLFIIRPDGTDNRMVYPAGHSLKAEVVYGQTLLLSVDEALYAVSLVTFDATLVVPTYAIGLAPRTLVGDRWLYGAPSPTGVGTDVHFLALDTFADTDLGAGAYCGATPNGDLVYTLQQDAGQPVLMRYRSSDGTTSVIDAVGSVATCGGVLPDGRIYYAGSRSIAGDDLYVTDANAQNPQLVGHGWDETPVTPTPDGRLLFFAYTGDAGQGGPDVLVSGANGAPAQALVPSPNPENWYGPVSTTGRLAMLLYGPGADVPPDIWSVHYDGTSQVKLFSGQNATGGNSGVDIVATSPAATVLFDQERPDLYFDLFTVPDIGGFPITLGTMENEYGNVALLPGERVAFTRDGSLFAMGLDGNGGKMLVSTPDTKQIETIFPDGRILFETIHASTDDLSIVDPDGTAVVPLAPMNDCQAFAMLAP